MTKKYQFRSLSARGRFMDWCVKQLHCLSHRKNQKQIPVYTLTSPKNTQNVMVQSFIKKRKRIAENHVNQHRKENVHSHRLEGGEPKESLAKQATLNITQKLEIEASPMRYIMR